MPAKWPSRSRQLQAPRETILVSTQLQSVWIRPAEREQADESDRAVANEVERVCLQRLASCDEPADRFNQAEAKIRTTTIHNAWR